MLYVNIDRMASDCLRSALVVLMTLLVFAIYLLILIFIVINIVIDSVVVVSLKNCHSLIRYVAPFVNL